MRNGCLLQGSRVPGFAWKAKRVLVLVMAEEPGSLLDTNKCSDKNSGDHIIILD